MHVRVILTYMSLMPKAAVNASLSFKSTISSGSTTTNVLLLITWIVMSVLQNVHVSQNYINKHRVSTHNNTCIGTSWDSLHNCYEWSGHGIGYGADTFTKFLRVRIACASQNWCPYCTSRSKRLPYDTSWQLSTVDVSPCASNNVVFCDVESDVTDADDSSAQKLTNHPDEMQK